MKGQRKKGMGTLEKRGGVWLARWVCGKRRFSRSTGMTDRRQAERLLAEWTAPFRLKTDASRIEFFSARLKGIDCELEAVRHKASAIRIEDAFDAFVAAPEIPDTMSEHTVETYGYRWRSFSDFMKRDYPRIGELRDVTRDHAAAYFRELVAQRVSATTYNLDVGLFKRMWKVLAFDTGNGLGEVSPFDRIARKVSQQHSRRALSTDELTEVCSGLTGEMRLLFAIGIYTGLRLGDACTLRWESVELQNFRMNVVPTKTANKTNHRVYTIPIHPVLFSMLSETPPGSRRGFVLPEAAERYIRDRGSTMGQRIKRIFESHGIATSEPDPNGGRKRPLVGFHSLRHTAVSMMANAGTPLAVVRRIVGHTSERMTSRYFHASDTALKSAVSSLPDVIGEGCHRPAPAAHGGNLAAFVEAADRLGADEIDEAMAYLAKRKRNPPVLIEAQPAAPEGAATPAGAAAETPENATQE